MNVYKVSGMSYETGYFVECGLVEANTERGALIKARKQFDTNRPEGHFGFSEFAVLLVA